MKTLSDKAVTNQSQCKSQMTVRDVSGVIPRVGEETPTCHCRFARSCNHKGKLFTPATFYSIPSQSCCSHTLILSSCAVLLVEARQKDTGGADRSGQVAARDGGFGSDGWASPDCCFHKSNCPPQTAPFLPTCHNVLQHRHLVHPAQSVPFVSGCVPLLSFTSTAHRGFKSHSSYYLPLSPLLCCPSADPTRVDYYPESELNHGRVMEHATFNTHTHTETH